MCLDKTKYSQFEGTGYSTRTDREAHNQINCISKYSIQRMYNKSTASHTSVLLFVILGSHAEFLLELFIEV